MFLIGLTVQRFKGTDHEIFWTMLRAIWPNSLSTTSFHMDGNGLGDEDELRCIDPTAKQELLIVSEINMRLLRSFTEACGSNATNAYARNNCEATRSKEDFEHAGVANLLARVQLLFDHRKGKPEEVLAIKADIADIAFKLSHGEEVIQPELTCCGVSFHAVSQRPVVEFGGYEWAYCEGVHSSATESERLVMPTMASPRRDVQLAFPPYSRKASDVGALQHRGRNAVSRLNACHQERALAAAAVSINKLIGDLLNGCERSAPVFVRRFRSTDPPIFSCLDPVTSDGLTLIGWLKENFPECQRKGWVSLWSLVVKVLQFVAVHCDMPALVEVEAALEIRQAIIDMFVSNPTRGIAFPLLPPADPKRHRKRENQHACLPLMLYRRQ